MLIPCHPYDTRRRIDHSIYNRLLALHMHCAAFHSVALTLAAACDGISSMSSSFHSGMDHAYPATHCNAIQSHCHSRMVAAAGDADVDAAVVVAVVVGNIYYRPSSAIYYIGLSWHIRDSVHCQLGPMHVAAVAFVEHLATELEGLTDWTRQMNTVTAMA